MERKKKTPLQISKTMNVTLFDEEVEAWQALEKFLLKKQRPIQSPRNAKKLSVQRVLREIMRMAVESMASETGDKGLVKKLQGPRLVNPVGRPARATSGVKTDSDKQPRRISWDH